MGMCRKMAAINDHFQSLEDELEIRDRKIEQISHDMNIVLTLFSKFEKRVVRTEHRTQHQDRSLKHLTSATTTKQDELASRLQNLSNATTTKQDELASRLQNLDNKVPIPIYIICSIRNRVVPGTSQFTQMHSGTSQEDTTLTLFETSESKLFSSHQISTNLLISTLVLC